jgi:hypothetical protein
VFLGTNAPGKSSIIKCFVEDKFDLNITVGAINAMVCSDGSTTQLNTPSHVAASFLQLTVGVDMRSKTVYLEDKPMNLLLW